MTQGIAVLAHSGGPTSVINASMVGAVRQAQKLGCFREFWGAKYGMEGLLAGNFIDLFAQSKDTMNSVAEAPSSALGSSRLAAGSEDLSRAVEVLKTHDVRCLFYTGGNGSMGTAHQLEQAARAAGYALQVIGIPKTIDNDLLETHHTPGYASAARFFANAVRDIGEDNRALPGQVEIVEILGRNAGWLAAATVLARHYVDDAPHLVYLPERPLRLSHFLSDVEACYRKLGRCVVAVCEGQRDEHGGCFGADSRPGSRGSLAMNLAHRLARLVNEHLGLRARSEKPGLLGRSGAAYRSERDAREAYRCGEAAVQAAQQGMSGKMVTLLPETEPDEIQTGTAALSHVAFQERLFPAAWIDAAGNDILPTFAEYALPFIGQCDHYAKLQSGEAK